MPLKITGSLTVDARREQVWNLLFDVEVLKKLAARIPGIGVERLVQVSDERYEGTATIGVAMVKGKYAVSITVLEKRAPEFVKFRGEGTSSGNWSSGEMSVIVTEQDYKTILTYEGIGNVGGTLASVGQRLIDTVGKYFIAHGSKALAEELAAHGKIAPHRVD